MSNNNQTYTELKVTCEDLQGQVMRFLKVEQDLINTRSELDRDLARFKAIQSYSQRIIQVESMEEFAEITVESVIETFEVECSAFFSYDKEENCLKVKSMSGFEEDHMDCKLDGAWIASTRISQEGSVIIENVSPDSEPMRSLGLFQLIIASYHDDNKNLNGILIGGVSESKKEYYDEISEELVPSFMVFTQQMSSLLQNFEAKKYLNEKVQRRTAEVVKQKKEIEDKNKVLEDQSEELRSMLENLKLTQSQLVQSEKMASLGQLVAGIAHEINNPVTFISAGVDSLGANLEEVRQVLDIYHRITPNNSKEKLKEIEELKEQIDYKQAVREINILIESIKTGTERTTQIVKGLRTFSRLDEDVLKVADIHDGLDSTLILLRNKYKHRIEIVKDYGDIPLFECFPGQLNQVFMNILSNAIDAIEEKGIITISTSKFNGFIRISIKDTGSGIPENIKAKIFDPFFTTKDVGEGTGLGLSISHGIIEKHNGSIKVKSEAGKGSEFIILVPVRHVKE
ncbi:MAG: ATP-binding protein [Bacteroides sp.]|nr:ATP-binding protein [Bacteroides sp.]